MLTRFFLPRACRAAVSPLPVGAVSRIGAMRDRLLALRGGCSPAARPFPRPENKARGSAARWAAACTPPELLEAMLLTGAQLGDEELRREALRLCGLVVEHQREDGSFGAPGETFAPPRAHACARSAPPTP